MKNIQLKISYALAVLFSVSLIGSIISFSGNFSNGNTGSRIGLISGLVINLIVSISCWFFALKQQKSSKQNHSDFGDVIKLIEEGK